MSGPETGAAGRVHHYYLFFNFAFSAVEPYIPDYSGVLI
jgi:hypothetical protein